jgi:hypothetical protein
VTVIDFSTKCGSMSPGAARPRPPRPTLAVGQKFFQKANGPSTARNLGARCTNTDITKLASISVDVHRPVAASHSDVAAATT